MFLSKKRYLADIEKAWHEGHDYGIDTGYRLGYKLGKVEALNRSLIHGPYKDQLDSELKEIIGRMEF